MKHYIIFILLVFSDIIFAQSNNHGVFALEKENGHYYFVAAINNKVPAKFLLESGIHVMLMDSAFVFENRGFINLDLVKVSENEKINLGGKLYNITHKAKGTMQLGNHAEYRGEIFVLSAFKSYSEIAIPIQNIYNTDDGSCIIKLDMIKQEFCSLNRKEFGLESQEYTVTAINYDSYMRMPSVKTKLDIEMYGKSYSILGNYLLDLGNAAFIFLMKQSPVVQNFVETNHDIELQKAYNKKGEVVAEAMLAEKVNLCGKLFEDQVIAITSALPRFTSEGSIGLKFFESSVSIFDFSDNKLYIK